MRSTSNAWRGLLVVAVVLGAIGLALNLAEWLQAPPAFNLRVALPKLVDQLGMLILVAALLLPSSRQVARNRLLMLAVILIVPSTVLVIAHAV